MQAPAGQFHTSHESTVPNADRRLARSRASVFSRSRRAVPENKRRARDRSSLKQFRRGLLTQSVAVARGPAVLPTMALPSGFPSRDPDHHRLPLVGDADRGDIPGGEALLVQNLPRDIQLGAPDLFGSCSTQPGRIALREFRLATPAIPSSWPKSNARELVVP